ncbi:MAG: PQQ-binding-like beta-propeller repeat protein [Chitinivibrionales bacterium]|nr:PQQ-binding-like beta-propeller repeat protein [Chitinivibrionales bacterium]MBD3355877.1 PQQ-binding-like beta-propeller repeat protein [Chitinivibrionales bacterium]
MKHEASGNCSYSPASTHRHLINRAAIFGLLLLNTFVVALRGQTAEDILSTTGMTGGIIVHIDVGDGRLTADLGQGDAFLVQGWDTNAGDVSTARSHVRSEGLYGKVSVEQLTSGTLPYRDNHVNLVVSENLGSVSKSEVNRVLAPGGKSYIKSDGSWELTTKTVPSNIDEWTHYLYDASNNCVSNDDKVGEPRSLQWQGLPEWSRHHDRIASIVAMVSAGGKVFYVIDEGLTQSILTPGHYAIIARDAYNGTLLWRREMDDWINPMWPLKSGPAWFPRRLVATADQVFVTMGMNAPLSALDPNTGATLRTYSNTTTAEEVIHYDGTIYVLVDPDGSNVEGYYNDGSYAMETVELNYPWDGDMRKIRAVNPSNGNLLWSKDVPVAPATMACRDNKLVFFNGDKVICLDRHSGDQLWSSIAVGAKSPIPTYFAPNLIIQDNTVIFWGGDSNDMYGFSLSNGSQLWNKQETVAGYQAPKDVFVVDGKVWTTEIEQGDHSGDFIGRNITSGKQEAFFDCDVDDRVYWFHHRCYRGKATKNFFLMSRTGIEVVDRNNSGDEWSINHWVRGGCLYGVLPANGLLYTPPNNCACYTEAKMSKFSAFSSTGPSIPGSINPASRLSKGSIYDEMKSVTEAATETNAWPTYRHNNERSGHTASSVTNDLGNHWKKSLGAKPGRLVVAEGKVFVPLVDAHQVVALNANTGNIAWRFTAGGRVDSPPTIAKKRAVFGCTDGYVYCVRVSDGELIWRFRAAPIDRRIMSNERIESLWPVHGSVLIRDDVVYAVAGRSMFLDGGLRFCRIDLITGELIGEKIMDEVDPESGSNDNLQMRMSGLNMPVALPDVLSCNDSYLFMRSQRMDFTGNRSDLTRTNGQVDEQKGADAHLFCATGFLDAAWMHRSYWLYGRRTTSGASNYYNAQKYAPAGRVLCFDNNKIYGFGRKPRYYKWSTPYEYQIFGADKEDYTVVYDGDEAQNISFDWTKEEPGIHITSMVLAGGKIYAAGSMDITDEQYDHTRMDNQAIADQYIIQEEHFKGMHEGELRVISTSDGSVAKTISTDAPPIVDGMVSAYGNIYMALMNGSVVCIGDEIDIEHQSTDGDYINIQRRHSTEMLYWAMDNNGVEYWESDPTSINAQWEVVVAEGEWYNIKRRNDGEALYMGMGNEQNAFFTTDAGNWWAQWKFVTADGEWKNIQRRHSTDILYIGMGNEENAFWTTDAGNWWAQWKQVPVDGSGSDDTTPPSPDPMTWETEPNQSSTDAVTMTASTASDPSGVEYYFECTSGGGNSSGWRSGSSYTDAGLTPGNTYQYRVRARDLSAANNTTAWSSTVSVTLTTSGTTYYFIKNAALGENLNGNGAGGTAQMVPSSWTGEYSQWEKEMVDDTWFLLKCRQNGKYLQALPCEKNGDAVRMTTSTTNAVQWKLVANGSKYHIHSKSCGANQYLYSGGSKGYPTLAPSSWTGNHTQWELNAVE